MQHAQTGKVSDGSLLRKRRATSAQHVVVRPDAVGDNVPQGGRGSKHEKGKVALGEGEILECDLCPDIDNCDGKERRETKLAERGKKAKRHVEKKKKALRSSNRKKSREGVNPKKKGFFHRLQGRNYQPTTGDGKPRVT